MAKKYRNKRIVTNLIRISNTAIGIKSIVTAPDATEIKNVSEDYLQGFGITKRELLRLKSAIRRIQEYYFNIQNEMLSIDVHENSNKSK